MPRLVRTSIADAAAPLALVAAVRASWGTPMARVLTGEDALLEWGQVLAFAAGALWLARAATLSRGRARWALLGATVVLAVAVGEELAWGTRLTNTSVDAIADANRQGEVTLHNLGPGLDASFVGLALVSVGLAVLVAVGRALAGAPKALVAWFAVPAVYVGFRLTAGDVSYEVAKLSEAVELAFAVGVARLAHLQLSSRRDVPRDLLTVPGAGGGRAPGRAPTALTPSAP